MLFFFLKNLIELLYLTIAYILAVFPLGNNPLQNLKSKTKQNKTLKKVEVRFHPFIKYAME